MSKEIKRHVTIYGQRRSRYGWQRAGIEADNVTLREALSLAARSGICRVEGIEVDDTP